MFHLVGFDCAGRLGMRKQIKRPLLNATFKQLARCIVGIAVWHSIVSRAVRGAGFWPVISPAVCASLSTRPRMTPQQSLRQRCTQFEDRFDGRQDQFDLQELHGFQARLVSWGAPSIPQIRAHWSNTTPAVFTPECSSSLPNVLEGACAFSERLQPVSDGRALWTGSIPHQAIPVCAALLSASAREQ